MRRYVGLVLTIQLAAVATLPRTAASQAAGESSAASAQTKALHERLQELDREIRHRLEGTVLYPGLARAPELGSDADRFARDLRELERELDGLTGEDAEALRHKLRALDNVLGNLEQVAAGGAPAAALPRSRERQPEEVPRRRASATPVNDACSAAVPLALGANVTGTTIGATRDGTASCGASAFSPDVWYSFTAASSTQVSADTFGSGYDTVLSIHTSCPGSLDNQLTCNDDAFGVQSAASFYTSSGQTYRIRVSGFGAAAGPFALHLGTGGSVSGTVTSSAAGTPLEGGRVAAYKHEDFFDYYVGSGVTNSSGQYSIAALPAWGYFLKAGSFSGYFDELYDDVTCRELPSHCPGGTPVGIPNNADVPGIDFALDAGGTLSGHVSQQTTGDPLAGVQVETYDAAGSFVALAFTNLSGNYAVIGLMSGSYFATASGADIAPEIYDGIPCSSGSCDPLSGTAIAVTAPQTTANVDFVLDRLGSLSGVITHAATGDPIGSASVDVYLDDAGELVYQSYGYTNASGAYSIGGLPAGDYVVVAGRQGYSSEVYDDVRCSGGYFQSCDLAAGTRLAVALNADVSGVDFALDRLGAVSGTVTHALTGNPLQNVRVTAWTSTGEVADWVYTDASGSYVVGLAAGTYFVTTSFSSDFVDELYDDLPCAGGCDPTTGTPVVVSAEATTSGIDFALDPGGAIAGTVTEAASGAPVANADVRIWDGGGALVRSGTTDASGHYTLGALAGGTYFVTADHSFPDGFGELYLDLPCPGAAAPRCDPTTGTPVAVAFNMTTSGIDFDLDSPGAISGTVTDFVGAPIGFASIAVFDASRSWLGERSTAADGTYRFNGLSAGTYYVTVRTFGQYFDELYDDLPCPAGNCDPITGSPVTVTLSTTTSGIDFTLDRLGAIAGTVTDLDAGPLQDVAVNLWNADGGWTDSASTAADGTYHIDGLPPGTYHVTTSNFYGFVDELYDDLPCPNGNCDPGKGSAVAVAFDATTQVSFALGFFAIRGAVTAADGGAPLPGTSIHVWDDLGSFPVSSTATDAAGNYLVRVPPGSYYVSTENHDGLLDELYAGMICPDGIDLSGGCDPRTGAPVRVGVAGRPATATGVDFALDVSITVFSDGFESGDLSAWASTVGGQ